MRLLAWLALGLVGASLVYATSDLPRLGDPYSRPAMHVSPRYISRSVQETATPNYVTAILADYRSYDTLGETTVILTAGLACLLILGGQLRRSGRGERS